MANREIYFNDPRLKMTIAGRLIVRLGAYAGYALLVVGAAMFLAGDVRLLRAFGLLLMLFLADRAAHARKSEKNILRLPEGKINAASYCAPASFGVLEWAFDRALFSGKNFYLFLAQRLLNRHDVQAGLVRMDVKPGDMKNRIEAALRESSAASTSKNQLLYKVGVVTAQAIGTAYRLHDPQIDPKDLFAALALVEDEDCRRLFGSFNIAPGDLQNAMVFSAGPGRNLTGFLSRPHKTRHRIMNRAWTARPTPYLDQVSSDLTDLARLGQIGMLIGHEQEYDRLLDVLSRPGRPNALLVGDAGSGKSSVVEHLAFEISKDRVPPQLFDRRLVKLDIGSLVAGAGESEMQARTKKILEEIVRAGNIILYIPDIHNLMKTAGGRGVSAADMLVPAIKSGAFSVIGGTYSQEYKQYIETNSDFAGGFETIRVQEVSEDEAAQYLVYESLLLERQYRIIISFAAVKEAVVLAKQYFHGKLLPASAEDLLKEALADAAGKRRKVLGADDVIAVAEKKINVPIHKAGKEEAETLLNLEEVIHARLIDQEEAVRAVSRALREYRSGLARKGGPIASFLFVGPTGVGKTELSKILAGIQFGSAEMMARFDMSEYQDKGTVNRLLENVTDAIRQRPYSLVLLDEFEKAHPDILNLFLQVLDDGRLTDAAGRTVDFQNTIVIATSNANSDFIKAELEKGADVRTLSEAVKKKLTGFFKPELLNRFSGIIVFKPLSSAAIERIAGIQLSEVAETLRQSQGIELQFDDEVVREIARRGFDPVFGARPLRGVISEQVRGVLAEKILRGEVARGSRIKAVMSNGALQFKNV